MAAGFFFADAAEHPARRDASKRPCSKHDGLKGCIRQGD